MPPRPEPFEPVDEPAGDGEVDLHTVLAVALLTPAQATLLIGDMTRQLAVGRGRALRDHSVTVSRDGRLTIAGDAGTGRDSIASAAQVLRAIAAACHDRAYVQRVDEAISEATGTEATDTEATDTEATDSDATDLADLARRVSAAVAVDLDPATAERTRHQIGRLVAATRGSRSGGWSDRGPRAPVGPAGDAAGASLAPTGWLAPVENPWHRRTWRPSKRQGVVAVIAIGVLVGAVWTAPAAWTQLREGWNTLLSPESQPVEDQIRPVSPPAPDTPAPAAGSPTGSAAAPVDTGLPGSSGPIAGVTATFANGNCAVGQQCSLRVDVRVDPRANVSDVTWKLAVYDRCSGAVIPGAEVTMPVPSGEQEVYGIGSVAVPAGTAVGIAALTSVPAAAASDPLYVPAENATCP